MNHLIEDPTAEGAEGAEGPAAAAAAEGPAAATETTTCEKISSAYRYENINGVKLDVFKSAIQKFLRRSEYKKGLGTLKILRQYETLENAEGNKIITNILNRIVVMMTEEVNINNPMLPVLMQDLYTKFHVTRNYIYLYVMYKTVALSKKCRLISDIKTRFNLEPYYEAANRTISVLDEHKKLIENESEPLKSMYNKQYPFNSTYVNNFTDELQNKNYDAYVSLHKIFSNKSEVWKAIISVANKTGNKNLQQVINSLQFFNKKMTHKEKPLYMYQAVLTLILRDQLTFIPVELCKVSLNKDFENPFVPGKDNIFPDYVYDVHTSAGRNLKKTAFDFAMEGSLVTDECTEFLNVEWRANYIKFKKMIMGHKDSNDGSNKTSVVKFSHKLLIDDSERSEGESDIEGESDTEGAEGPDAGGPNAKSAGGAEGAKGPDADAEGAVEYEEDAESESYIPTKEKLIRCVRGQKITGKNKPYVYIKGNVVFKGPYAENSDKANNYRDRAELLKNMGATNIVYPKVIKVDNSYWFRTRYLGAYEGDYPVVVSNDVYCTAGNAYIKVLDRKLSGIYQLNTLPENDLYKHLVNNKLMMTLIDLALVGTGDVHLCNVLESGFDEMPYMIDYEEYGWFSLDKQGRPYENTRIKNVEDYILARPPSKANKAAFVRALDNKEFSEEILNHLRKRRPWAVELGAYIKNKYYCNPVHIIDFLISNIETRPIGGH